MTDNYPVGSSVASPMQYPGSDGRLLLPGEARPADRDHGSNIFAVVLDRMSGRWKLAWPLAIVLAVAFAFLGYRSASITYLSTGVIRVAPRITPIMHETAETGLMPNYSQFVNTEATLLTSPRVLERAVKKLDLSALPWSTERETLLALRRGLTVSTEFNSELITVSFRSESPAIAQRMTNALLEAFEEVKGSSESDDLGRRLQHLRTIRENLRAQVRAHKAQIHDLISSSEFAVSDFNSLIEQRAMQVQGLEAEIRRLEAALTSAEHEDDPRRASSFAIELDPSVQGQLAELGVSVRDVERHDPELERLASDRDQSRMELERARSRFRPGHRAYKDAVADFQLIDRLYRERFMVVIDQLNNTSGMSGLDASPSLRAQLEYLRREVAAHQQQTREMSELQLAITDIRNDLEEYEQELSEVSSRIRSLEIESDAIRGGRINIASYGEFPLQPDRDRRKSLAVIGAMTGLGIGFGFFFLLGTIDRRAYAVHQLRNGAAANRLLGVLPALPQNSADLEAAGVAAHCVHQIRNHIEAIREPTSTGVLVISSPFQGDGKTSLVMALGASYAASGYRTILVDCDLVGQSLTHHLQVHGEAGLREAIQSGRVNGSIRPLGSRNLSVLAVGKDRHFGPERIRKNDLVKLFDELRSEFDIVLVDTGPMFGSVESLPTASAADGVILTMWRGRRQARLEECITSLSSVGARYLGMVLNHARAADCERYVSKSKISAIVESERDDVGETDDSTRRRQPRNALLRAMHVSSSDDA